MIHTVLGNKDRNQLWARGWISFVPFLFNSSTIFLCGKMKLCFTCVCCMRVFNVSHSHNAVPDPAVAVLHSLQSYRFHCGEGKVWSNPVYPCLSTCERLSCLWRDQLVCWAAHCAPLPPMSFFPISDAYLYLSVMIYPNINMCCPL